MELENIKKEIEVLEQKVNEINLQQVSYPIDHISDLILKKDVLVHDGTFVSPVTLVTYSDALRVNTRGFRYLLESSAIIIE